MNYTQARAKAARLNCPHALAAALKDTKHLEPQPDAPAVVQCKEKVRRGDRNDRCGNLCPEGRKV